MNGLLTGLLGALLATNQPQSVSNLIQQQTGMAVAIPDPNDPAHKELKRLMVEDDAAMAEVDKWIQDNQAFAAQGGGESKAELNARIRARLDVVRKHYEDFLQRHPNFADAHLAFAGFLNDIGDEEAAKIQNEKAMQLDPKNPAAWNNLANYYSENGEVTNAFAYLAKAIELDPNEPLYYQNLGVVVFLFRKDAEAFYHINEQQVFDKSIALYRKAIQLDPENFSLGADYAEGYYIIRPFRTDEALEAWTNVLHMTHDETQHEWVCLHLARTKMLAGRFTEARAQLDVVTNAQFVSEKHTLENAINWWQNRTTNPAAAMMNSTNLSDSSTNILSAPTNRPAVVTNATIVPTHSSALTNSPPFSAKSSPQ